MAQLQEQLSLRQKEVEDARARTKGWEEKCKALDAEKEALIASHTNVRIKLSIWLGNSNRTIQETAGLRNAHSKALETLMTYQEENDMLRATVQELTGNDFPRSIASTKARKNVVE